MRKHLVFILSAFAACMALSACDDDNKKDSSSADECDPATYAAQCDKTDNMTQYYCSSDKKINKRSCPNGCNKETGMCVDVSENNCRAGTTIVWKCSEDGKTSSGCRNNAEATDTCNYGCNPSTGRCNPEPCTENTYRCNDNNLQKCVSQTWTTEQECGNLSCNDSTRTCEAKTNPSGCTNNTYRCNDNDLEFCENNTWTLKQACGDLLCDEFLEECFDENEKVCTVHCDYNDLTLITCDEDNNEIYTECTVGCVNAECIDNSCAANTPSSCRTTKERRICENGHYTTKPCEDGTLCVDGECVQTTSVDDCNWSGSICSDDNRSVKTCANGKASTTKCDDGYTCGAAAACEKSYTGDKITSNAKCDSSKFIPFCGAVEGSTYEINTIECINDVITTKGCAENRVCEVGYADNTVSCRPKSAVERLKLGEKCSNDDKFAKTAICIDGNIPAACDSSTGVLTAVESYKGGCKKYGMICSLTDVENAPDVYTASCFDPCDAEGIIQHACISAGDIVYQVDQRCSDLGDGQLGYVDIEGTFNPCDMECSAGKCVDYTAEIPNAGKSCDLLPNHSSYCLNSSLLVECAEYTDANDQEVSLIAGEKCYTYETCTTHDDVAKCRQNCKPGDPNRSVCQSFLLNEYSAPTVCTNVNGTYVYVESNISEWTNCKNGCQDGKCL